MCAAVTKIVFFAPSANFLLTHYAWPSVIEAWCGRSGRLDLPKAHLNLHSCYLPAHIQCFTRVNSCDSTSKVGDLPRASALLLTTMKTLGERGENSGINMPKAIVYRIFGIFRATLYI
jgi:hypothetical protein